MLPKKDYVFCIEIKIKDAQPIKTDVISQIHIINFLLRLQKKNNLQKWHHYSATAFWRLTKVMIDRAH